MSLFKKLKNETINVIEKITNVIKRITNVIEKITNVIKRKPKQNIGGDPAKTFTDIVGFKWFSKDYEKIFNTIYLFRRRLDHWL